MPTSPAGVAAETEAVVSLKRNDGFALLELLVVVLILGMVSALVFPSMSRAMGGVRLKTTSRDALNLFRIAREMAIRDQEILKVRVDFVQNTLSLADYFGGLRSRYPLPEDIRLEGIRIEGAAASSQEIVDVYFYPEGYATAAELTLKIHDSETRAILLTDPVTGTVTLARDDGDEGR